jgi:predicted MPP superfamily phosphohydrolase
MSLDPGGRAQPRRLGLSILGTATMGAAVGSVIAYHSRFRAPFEPVLERVRFAGLASDAAMPPLRVGFVTDVHIGPTFRAVDAERALNLIAAEKPDLFLLGGDYVCESPRFLNEAAAVLGAFVTQARFGALAVLGNHDYSNDAPRLTALLERVGIRVLRNEAACVPSETNPLWVAGIDDAVLGRPDLCAAFKPIPDGARPLVVWHQPDWAELAASRGAALQLSGHSHGGQVRLPIIGAVAAPVGGRRFIAGHNHVEGMAVYTSRGVGIYRPPVRFRCSPEVTLITLC